MLANKATFHFVAKAMGLEDSLSRTIQIQKGDETKIVRVFEGMADTD